MNPGFGGVHPEPIARYLGALAGTIGSGWAVWPATDGDADRTGAMDERASSTRARSCPWRCATWWRSAN
jgi:phosphomannomutase